MEVIHPLTMSRDLTSVEDVRQTAPIPTHFASIHEGQNASRKLDSLSADIVDGTLIEMLKVESWLELDLTGCIKITDSVLPTLDQLCPDMISLWICETRLSSLSTSLFSRSFGWLSFSNLTHLQLENNPQLKSCSLRAPKLKTLSLQGNCALTSLCLETPALENLSLDNCKKLSTSVIRGVVRSCPALKRVTLTGCDLSGSSHPSLINRQNGLIMKHNLSALPKGARGVIAEAFMTPCRLTKVELKFDHINVEACRALGGALKVNTSITHLKLMAGRQNEIGDAGLIALSSGLEINRTVRDFSIWGANFTCRGLRTLAEAFKVNSSLHSVQLGLSKVPDIYPDPIEHEKLEIIADGLGNSPSIKEAQFNSTEIDAFGGRIIGTALHKNRSLRVTFKGDRAQEAMEGLKAATPSAVITKHK